MNLGQLAVIAAQAKIRLGTTLTPVEDSIPVASDLPPLSIGDSDPGISGLYARADHVHPDSGQRARLQCDGSGILVWTFSPAFSDPPIVVATAEDPAGAWISTPADETSVEITSAPGAWVNLVARV